MGRIDMTGAAPAATALVINLPFTIDTSVEPGSSFRYAHYGIAMLRDESAATGNEPTALGYINQFRYSIIQPWGQVPYLGLPQH
jgi:hypothetical protein